MYACTTAMAVSGAWLIGGLGQETPQSGVADKRLAPWWCAPQSMIQLSRTQDEEVGDGTTSVIILGERARCNVLTWRYMPALGAYAHASSGPHAPQPQRSGINGICL